MLSPCLLLSLLFTAARSYSSARHSGDVRPSCEQLREFWDEMNRVTQTSEITNEIPILPLQVQNAMDPMLMATPLKNTQRGKSYRNMLQDKSPYFVDVTNPYYRYSALEQPALLPTNSILSKQQAPSNEDRNGVFGGFHGQAADEQTIGSSKHQAIKSPYHASPSGVPLGNKKNSEIEYFIPQWGLPEEVDTFGSFVDLDFSSPYLPMTRTPKGIKSQWSPIAHEEVPQSCDAVINSDCRIKEECFCKGKWKLTCTNGKCLSNDNQEDIGAKYGIWHDGPIPHSELQRLARRQRRSYRSIFM